MKRFSTIIYFCGILILALCVQTTGAAETKEKLIGPGDRIELTIVVGGEPRHESKLTVSPGGTIKIPLLGELRASGLTYSELEEAIRVPLSKDYYVDPKVNITVESLYSDREGYYIWGAVQKPGLIKMPYDTRLLKLIVSAGGVTADAGTTAYIIRNSENAGTQVISEQDLPPESQRIEVPLRQLLEHGDAGNNPIVQPGDIVYIPFKETLSDKSYKIYIEGNISKPGVYDFQEGITALKACIAAGGFNEYSAPNRAKIFRGSGEEVETIKINLIRVQKGKEKDILLKPDDRIHIPQSWF